MSFSNLLGVSNIVIRKYDLENKFFKNIMKGTKTFSEC